MGIINRTLQSMNWYVVYTKPKNEKKVAKQLEEMGITVFCPLKTVLRQWSDRKKRVEEPLFSSYVFVQLDDKARAKVFDAVGVVRYLFWLGKPAIVRDNEIERLKKWLSSDYKSIETQRYTPGNIIQIAEGPFMGQHALVNEQRGKKIRLQLEAIGIEIIIELKD